MEKKLYYAYVSFYQPQAGIIPIEAENEEEVKKIITAQLQGVKGLNFYQIIEESKMEDIDIDEDDKEDIKVNSVN